MPDVVQHLNGHQMIQRLITRVIFSFLLFWSNQTFCQDSLQVRNVNDVIKLFGRLNVPKDTFSIEKGKDMINALKGMNFSSGIIHFSGSGFQDVVTVTLFSGSAILPFLEKVTIGSTITFNKCKPKLVDAVNQLTIHKSIYIK